MTASSSYRADVDGLRAIAVVAVLLFHLAVPGFSGGFVGVDVFFVISGYLITGLIISDQSGNTFSLKTFYLRRIRRLMPALVVMLVPTTVAAVILLQPMALKAYAASLSFQFLPLQNFHFLVVGDYFTAAETKPLLHTWTLAVEEQFYLVWPLALLFLRRYSLRIRFCWIAVLMVLSFGLNLGLMRVSPKASFFLLPARAWELGAGGLLAMWQAQWSGNRPAWLNQKSITSVLAIGGLVAVVVPVSVFNASTPFPGWAAIAPVAGAAALILAGSGAANPVSGFLSARALVYVGKLSYPLYLWHWPLISFAYLQGAELGGWELTVGLALLTWILSDLTVRFVESPIRGRRWLKAPRSLVSSFAAAALVVTVLGGHVWATHGAAYRYSDVAQRYLLSPLEARSGRCGFMFRVLHPTAQVCSLVEVENSQRRVLLWGNSHADMWSMMMRELAESAEASLYLNARNCRAVNDSEFCGRAVQRQILEFIRRQGVTDVVLASTWHGAYDRPDDEFEESFIEVLNALDALAVRVWLVVDTPRDDSFHPETAFNANPDSPSAAVIPFSEFEPVRAKQMRLFKHASQTLRRGRVQVVDPTDVFCDGMQCMGGGENGPWYRDGGHLNDAGARHAAALFKPVFGASTVQLSSD